MGPKHKKIRKKVPISVFETETTSDPALHRKSYASGSVLPRSRIRQTNRPVVSRKITQSTITRFHILLKQQAAIRKKISIQSPENDNATLNSLETSLAAVEQEMEDLGGLKAYQNASTLGQSNERGGDSSKVLIKWLRGLGLKQEAISRSSKLRMLEIGALTPGNYSSSSNWIDNHPIDLHSQHPDIAEQDFFVRPIPTAVTEAFDIVSCSLVLNFVSSAPERGKMLSLIHDQLKPTPQSLLFLVLPLPCLVNSRYLSIDSFKDLMRIVGFTLEQEHWKPGGKVGYWLWRWAEKDDRGSERWGRKLVEKDGPKKNNFAVVLP
ncbi:uncharacterized protein IL334_005897 [Kwoniella shivajii]|uniref:25S rRNA adenine-N(1) methyltransferase n=1 Tax=Kwoniella shivajii TaxID=564305 RepID=A0ABZ1D6A2_9TREE|nr:hypothetical protein IL334_005897 [Kwoniella shivajii]